MVEEASEAAADAWKRTIGEMEAMADERASSGWEATALTAADTAPEPPEAGNSDRFGFVYTLGEDDADSFAEAHAEGFDRYEVYRNQVGDRLFLVTELQNAAAERVVFLAGAVDTTVAGDLRAAAAERGEVYTHVQTLDWTHHGSVRHDDPAAFFPSLDD